MTRFLSASTSRNAQQSALAVDVIALMDALGIEKAIIAGLIGEQGPPTSSRRSGRSGAEPSSP
jgi:hypothetical protein